MQVTDQTGSLVVLSRPVQRIVSLVPSQTELLAALNLEEQVVGITKFCVHPDNWFRTKTRIGGTKQVHPDRVRSLAPDLIIANKEENVKEQVQALAAEFPVWVSDVNDLPSALSMIRDIGTITDREQEAAQIADSITTAFAQLASVPPKKAAYLIWKEPYMVAGGDTFINDMLARAGFENVFAAQNRYPTVSEEALLNSDAEVFLFSSEPYPFRPQHLETFQRAGRACLLVDGELFSWYGSRLLQAPAYFSILQQQISQAANGVHGT